MNPDELLAEAASLWHSSRTASRDAKLRIGRLLHDFLLARIAEGGHKARENAVQEVCSRFGQTSAFVNTLVRVAMTADLLSSGGDVGALSYYDLRILAALVQRKLKRPTRGVPQADTEEWEAKSGCDAAGIFRRAVAEGWGKAQIRKVILSLDRKFKRSRPDRDRDGKAGMPNLPMLARTSTPRDLAEMIGEMIRLSSNPEMVGALVAEAIKTLKRRVG